MTLQSAGVRIPAQHPLTVRVVPYELSITDRVELAHQVMTLGGVNRPPLGVVTVKLQDGGRLSPVVNSSPSVCRNILKRTVQQHALGMRIVPALVVRQAAQLSPVRQSLQVTVHEHVAMILCPIANPHKGPMAGDGAMVEERRVASQYRVAPAVNAAVQPVAAAIGLQGIAVADYVYVLKEVALPVHQQPLGLPLAVRPDGQVAQCEVTAVVGSKGSTPRGEGAAHLVGRE